MSADIVAEIKQFLKEKPDLTTSVDSIKNVYSSAHPKALELELGEIEDYISELYNKLISEKTLEDLQENIVEDACDDVQDNVFRSAEDSQKDKIEKVEQYKTQLKQLQHNIYSLADSSETDKNLIKACQKEATEYLDDIMAMEKELHQDSDVFSQKPEYTAEEAQDLMNKLMVEMSELMALNEKNLYSIAEKSPKLNSCKAEIIHLKAENEFHAEKTQLISYSYQQIADQATVEKYQGYKKYTEFLCRKSGIEEITTEANGDLRVVYALPHHVELRISLDNEREVITRVKMKGGNIHIEDIVAFARKMNVYNGIKMIIVETLFRLNNKVEL